MYHIHIDATLMPDSLYKYVKEELGFYDHHFIGHPQGYRYFAPKAHLTFKPQTAQEFSKVWKQLEERTKQTDFIGYLEGEWIRSDLQIPYKLPILLPVPFQISRRRLLGGPLENFRQAEIHLVMDKDASDQKLIKKLLEAGLYGAYLPKKDHTAIVLTMQGYRKDIDPLAQRLLLYLNETGGAEKASLTEERAIRYRLFGTTPQDQPEIADKIIYSDISTSNKSEVRR